MSKIISLVCGVIFGIGLTVSQMIDPAKVLGFLNIFGDWDPSLAFVMIGALIISSPFFHLFKNNNKPIFSEKFSYSQKKEINKKLIVGSSLFGAGWGLAGLCPGPAIASLALLNINSAIFVVTMFIGFYLVKLSEPTTQAR
ncbi:YeeE/YedE family protein [Candidatus Pelagibacter sp.]|nr:YeeE/YedE family protein [Candidatus Pelagibacter sp.]MDA9966717.1 YeeE/YedE family protein [Candidatus Pelagibacter sp.]MDB0029674.1 YeeE/YedE family protein [bacterium]MDC0627007.1 YeeE/YedE family protein [Candidatus Pelagibacter sp.]MDC1330476.1 YeeE/YedE family protein [Pelagibacteraceae bacterium]